MYRQTLRQSDMGAMTDLPDETFGSWGDWDTFHLAYEKFNEGCHTLVLWPLHAAINHLKEEAEAEVRLASFLGPFVAVKSGPPVADSLDSLVGWR